MTLEQLLMEVRRRKLILISESEIWPSPNVTRELHKAIRKHRQGLALLLRWSSIDTCPSRDLHRKYWRYAGGGHYTCDVCQRIEIHNFTA